MCTDVAQPSIGSTLAIRRWIIQYAYGTTRVTVAASTVAADSQYY